MTHSPAHSLLAHSLIGASSMSRLIACPASFGLSQKVPGGGGSSIHAARGTVAHALAEECLTQHRDPAAELGEAVTVDGHEITVDEDMVQGVRVYVDEVRRRAAGSTWRGVETRVCLDPYWPAGDQPPVSAFGTADTLIYHGMSKHLDVVDYKNGAGVFVDVADNPQLFYYAAGALLQIPGPVLTVDLVIIQPNIRGADKIRTYRTTTMDVLIWVEDVLKPTVLEATLPGPRIASGKHCRFCPARKACPALAAISQDMARRDFAPTDAEPVTLTDDELADFLTDAETVAVHVDALRDEARAKIEAGTRVPGWTVVPSRPLRSWSVPVDVLRGLTFDWLDERVLLEPCKPRSPAQLEKLLTPEQWALLAPFVKSKSSGVRLVQETPTAPGASGRATAQEDFA